MSERKRKTSRKMLFFSKKLEYATQTKTIEHKKKVDAKIYFLFLKNNV